MQYSHVLHLIIVSNNVLHSNRNIFLFIYFVSSFRWKKLFLHFRFVSFSQFVGVFHLSFIFFHSLFVSKNLVYISTIWAKVMSFSHGTDRRLHSKALSKMPNLKEPFCYVLIQLKVNSVDCVVAALNIPFQLTHRYLYLFESFACPNKKMEKIPSRIDGRIRIRFQYAMKQYPRTHRTLYKCPTVIPNERNDDDDIKKYEEEGERELH